MEGDRPAREEVQERLGAGGRINCIRRNLGRKWQSALNVIRTLFLLIVDCMLYTGSARAMYVVEGKIVVKIPLTEARKTPKENTIPFALTTSNPTRSEMVSRNIFTPENYR